MSTSAMVKRMIGRNKTFLGGVALAGLAAGFATPMAAANTSNEIRWRITKTIEEYGFLHQGPSRWTVDGVTVGQAFTGDEDQWMPGSISAIFWSALDINDHHDELSWFEPGNGTGSAGAGEIDEPTKEAGEVTPEADTREHRQMRREVIAPEALGNPSNPQSVPKTYHVHDFYWAIGLDCLALPVYVHPTETRTVQIVGSFEAGGNNANPDVVITIDGVEEYDGDLFGFDPAVHGLERHGLLSLQEEFCLGDVTGDKVVGVDDVRLIFDQISEPYVGQYDLNNDDAVTMDDVRIALDLVGSACPNPCLFIFAQMP